MSKTQTIHHFIQNSLDFLFPRRCPFCEKVIGFTPCKQCEKELKSLSFPIGGISKTSPGKVYEYLDAVYACFEYENLVRNAMIAVKQGGREDLIHSLAKYYIQRFCAENLGKQYDVIVPVPATKSSIHARGYNQTLLLAKQMQKAGCLPFYKDCLYKTKDTKRQMTLPRKERLQNVVGAFAVKKPESIKNIRVLLLDDVTTTGSYYKRVCKNVA
ncbi:MAG: ComF family protein [Oscillospiraceae bacterium]